MDIEQVLQELRALPPAAQQEVMDFIAFLRQRYPAGRKTTVGELSDEPFVGIWRDRTDMDESSEWVRTLRMGEWG